MSGERNRASQGVRIPFSPPDIREEDIAAVVSVLRSGWITTGPVSRDFEDALSEYVGTERFVALNSCTAALELTLRLLEVGPADEVVVPAYTYTATAAVVQHVGARLVLVDNAPNSYMPDVDRILNAVTKRTKAIIVVDIAGVPFPVEALLDALQGTGSPGRKGLANVDRPVVIVDAAHSLGAIRNGKKSGQLGDFTAFSFHAVKNLTTAEGGALTWRCDLGIDGDECAATVRRLSLHGQTKDALAKTRAGDWEYDIVQPAYKANMPDVLAALGLSQLSRYDEMVERRHQIVAAYVDGLDGYVTVEPHAGPDWRSSAHLALTDLGSGQESRERIIREMAAAGIATNVHYKPLPLLTAYRNMGFDYRSFPNAMASYQGELTLPLHTLLRDRDVAEIITTLRKALRSGGK